MPPTPTRSTPSRRTAPRGTASRGVASRGGVSRGGVSRGGVSRGAASGDPRRGRRAVAAGLAGLALAGCGVGQRPTFDDGPPGSTPAPATDRQRQPLPSGPARSGPPAGGGITLLFTGDMLVSDDLRAQAARDAGGNGYDFGPMLRGVTPLISAADWSVCHQETPISADNAHLSGYPAFNAPHELAAAEKAAGYDACTTASNHTVDLGAPGIQATLSTFDSAGIRHVGSARTEAESRQLTIYNVRGVRVGHLAYTFGLNGINPPTPWAVNLIDPARIRADAARIRAAGAQFVVVSLHMGEEKQQQPSAYQRQTADAVMSSPDVDLIVGHHAHVVQPIERRDDGRWVIFGVGNFLAQQEVTPPDLTPPHRDGVIIRVTIARAAGARYAVTRVGYIPTFVNAPTDVVQLAPPFSAKRTATILRSEGAPVVDDTPH
jgi:poly-gamma-glutamate capsule biosynthesis protein CapA/YwtB (metallophosphatase superfamily)